MPGQHHTLKNVVAKYPLLLFYVLAYFLSWVVWITGIVFHHQGEGIPEKAMLFFFIPGAYGPFFASILITRFCEGKTGVIQLFRRLVLWRVAFRWYLAALLLFTGINLVSALSFVWPLAIVSLYDYLENIARFLVFSPLFLVVGGIFGGPLGEELGWSGFALPRLQIRTHNAFMAACLHGPIWALWHLPYLYFGHSDHLSAMSLGLYMLSLTGGCIMITWMLNNTHGSILLPLIMHTSWNIGGNFLFKMFPSPMGDEDIRFSVIRCAILVLTGLIIVILFGPTRLTRTGDAFQ